MKTNLDDQLKWLNDNDGGLDKKSVDKASVPTKKFEFGVTKNKFIQQVGVLKKGKATPPKSISKVTTDGNLDITNYMTLERGTKRKRTPSPPPKRRNILNLLENSASKYTSREKKVSPLKRMTSPLKPTPIFHKQEVEDEPQSLSGRVEQFSHDIHNVRRAKPAINKESMQNLPSQSVNKWKDFAQSVVQEFDSAISLINTLESFISQNFSLSDDQEDKIMEFSKQILNIKKERRKISKQITELKSSQDHSLSVSDTNNLTNNLNTGPTDRMNQEYASPSGPISTNNNYEGSFSNSYGINHRSTPSGETASTAREITPIRTFQEPFPIQTSPTHDFNQTKDDDIVVLSSEQSNFGAYQVTSYSNAGDDGHYPGNKEKTSYNDPNSSFSNFSDTVNQYNAHSSDNFGDSSVHIADNFGDSNQGSFDNFGGQRNYQLLEDFVPLVSNPNDRPAQPEKYRHTNFPWTKKVDGTLRTYFGIQNGFRSHQREAINATLDKRDVFVIMPTGGGKSLCYQLPASISPGTTIVVSPLLSLIKDQVLELEALNIGAAYLIGDGDYEKQYSIYDDIQSQDPKIKLLYVTPEKIDRSGKFRSCLLRMYQRGTLSRIVIDEAHCVSKWGHDFRPDYLKLTVFKEKFPDVPIMALTATATSRVEDDVKVQLKIPNCIKLKSSFNRVNLYYEVRKKRKGTVNDEIATFIRSKYANQCGIIYCLSIKDVDQLAEHLREERINCAVYHSKCPEKHENHENWKLDKVKVMIATVAFGMGINKPDVRFVIHHSMPKTIEDYYQESGRAGRDGRPSHCLLFYSGADKQRYFQMIKKGMEERQLTDPSVQVDMTETNKGLSAMQNYCQNTVQCRRQITLAHFGERFDPIDCKKTCDNCKLPGTQVEKDYTALATDFIQFLSENKKAVGQGTLILAFRGSKAKKIVPFQTMSTFGKGKRYNNEDIKKVIHKLVKDSYVFEEEQNGFKYSYKTLKVNKDKIDGLLSGNEKILITEKIVGVIRQKQQKVETSYHDTRLMSILLSVRGRLAEKYKRAQVLICSNTAIEDMAEKKPKTWESLLKTNDLARGKAEKFGIPFFAAIREHCSKVEKSCEPLGDREKKEIEATFSKTVQIQPKASPGRSPNRPSQTRKVFDLTTKSKSKDPWDVDNYDWMNEVDY